MNKPDWDQAATLIDLEGRIPLISTVRECVRHFAMLKPFAQEQARMLLTKPVHREGRKTRTWLLEPWEMEALAVALREESGAA